jgi:8-oxo-dGTP diphosphatase
MTEMTGDGEVRAAGGVVVRDGLVLLVHRPAYGDWTLPKGKAEAGESDEACAVREVREETGFECSLGAELPSTRYHDRFGRAKVVRYWRMELAGGRFTPNHEVDEVAWLTVGEARRRLTYARDAAILDAAVSAGETRLPT